MHSQRFPRSKVICIINLNIQLFINSILGLNDLLNHQEDLVNNMRKSLIKSGKTNNDISSAINKLVQSEVGANVQASLAATDGILADLNAINIKTVANDTAELRKKLGELELDNWDIQSSRAMENISTSLINIREFNNMWSLNEKNHQSQNQKFQAWNSSFSLRLQELKDKIARAKHAAEGVSCCLNLELQS